MGGTAKVLSHGGGNPCLVDGRPCAAPGDLGAAGTARRHAFPPEPWPTRCGDEAHHFSPGLCLALCLAGLRAPARCAGRPELQRGYRPGAAGRLAAATWQPWPCGHCPKRDWTYRHAVWLGHSLGVPLTMPARHPFHPLPLLRQALACKATTAASTALSRVRCSAMSGRAGTMRSMRSASKPWRPSWSPTQARTPTAHAPRRCCATTPPTPPLHAACLAMPAFEVDGKVFWGMDSLPMLRGWLEGDAWFDTGWDVAASVAWACLVEWQKGPPACSVPCVLNCHAQCLQFCRFAL